MAHASAKEIRTRLIQRRAPSLFLKIITLFTSGGSTFSKFFNDPNWRASTPLANDEVATAWMRRFIAEFAERDVEPLLPQPTRNARGMRLDSGRPQPRLPIEIQRRAESTRQTLLNAEFRDPHLATLVDTVLRKMDTRVTPSTRAVLHQLRGVFIQLRQEVLRAARAGKGEPSRDGLLRLYVAPGSSQPPIGLAELTSYVRLLPKELEKYRRRLKLIPSKGGRPHALGLGLTAAGPAFSRPDLWDGPASVDLTPYRREILKILSILEQDFHVLDRASWALGWLFDITGIRSFHRPDIVQSPARLEPTIDRPFVLPIRLVPCDACETSPKGILGCPRRHRRTREFISDLRHPNRRRPRTRQ